MFSLWVQNERGETYELTHQQDKFIVSNVDGLGYPVNNINISPAVNVDGGRYNSAHLNPETLLSLFILLVTTFETAHSCIKCSRQSLTSKLCTNARRGMYTQRAMLKSLMCRFS